MNRTTRIARRLVADYDKAAKLFDAIESFRLGRRMLWVGEGEPEARPLRPEIGPKPRGGLWYSPGSEWARFIMYDLPESARDQVYSLWLNYGGMFVPQSILQMNEFIYDYKAPTDYNNRSHFRDVQIDWSKVTPKFSGVDVTKIFDREHPMLYSWDAPSGVVWDSSALVRSKLVLQYDGEQYQFAE